VLFFTAIPLRPAQTSAGHNGKTRRRNRSAAESGLRLVVAQPDGFACLSNGNDLDAIPTGLAKIHTQLAFRVSVPAAAPGPRPARFSPDTGQNPESAGARPEPDLDHENRLSEQRPPDHADRWLADFPAPSRQRHRTRQLPV